jgi:hypothetical protein
MRTILLASLAALAACTVAPRATTPAVRGFEASPAPRATAEIPPARVPSITWRPSAVGPATATPRTAADAAKSIADAIDVWDIPALGRRIDPAGWVAAKADETSWRLLPAEAVHWLRIRTPDGRIRATIDPTVVVERREDEPSGDAYVRSVWTAFDGRDSVRVRIVLRAGGDGLWYWTGIVIDPPER